MNTMYGMNTMDSMNYYADFWRDEIGVNVIPADTQKKNTWIEWTQYQEEPIPLQVHEGWKKSGAFNAGLAVIVGKVHHNVKYTGLYLYCIDCDNEKAIKEFFPNGLEYAKKHTLIEWHDDDVNKCHVYGYSKFPLPKKSSDKTDKNLAQKITANEIPAIEVKGKGKDGIMFATPSKHKDGYKYRLGECRVPKITETGIEKKIDEICHKYGIPYLTGLKDESNKIPMADLLSNKIIIHQGHNRHEAILRVAEHYAATIPNVSIPALVVLTDEKNKEICQPFLDYVDIEKICNQAIPYVKKTLGLPKVKTASDVIEQHVTIAERIMTQHNFLTLAKTHEILFYQKGVYKYGGEEIISQEARAINNEIKYHSISEIKSYIQDKTGYVTVEEFDDEIYQINVINGIINIKTGDMIEHSPKILSRIQLPIIYDNKARCTKFLRYLKSVSDDGAMKKTLIEMMSLCLLKAPLFHKSFVNTGEGGNGKTVLLNVLAGVLGKSNIATQTIHDLQYNKFSTSSLDGKLANIAGDIDPDALKSTGHLKDIIGGGILSAEKKFQKSYNFVNFATLIFSANEIPSTKDVTDGFARRFVIIQWDKQFFGKDENHGYKTLHHDGTELSGVLNLMLRNLINLIKTNQLTHEPEIKETKRIWQEKSDSVDAFLNNEMIYQADYFSTIIEIYVAYVNWCRSNTRYAKPQSVITKNLKTRGCTSVKTRIKSQNNTKWIGCKLNVSSDVSSDISSDTPGDTPGDTPETGKLSDY